MTELPSNRTRFFVLLWLTAGLVLLAWYLGDQTPVAGGRVMAQMAAGTLHTVACSSR